MTDFNGTKLNLRDKVIFVDNGRLCNGEVSSIRDGIGNEADVANIKRLQPMNGNGQLVCNSINSNAIYKLEV
jgi:hypothetical protein